MINGAVPLTGDTQMSEEDQVQIEDDDLDTLDAFDDDVDSSEPDEDPLESPVTAESDAEARANARRKIERRNELKALNSELDEWDEPLDVDDL